MKKKQKISINDNERLLKGFNTVIDGVKQTLGSEGGLAVMANDFGNPDISKDGISIAKKMFFDDPQENLGATLAKQVCATTLVKSGDATTTAAVLAQAIVREMGNRYNKKVERGLNTAYDEITEHLNKLARKITDSSAKKIANISANNNKELGELVYRAYKTVGESGIIDVQEADSPITQMKDFKGMKLQKGYMNPWFITNQNTASFEMENVLVLVYEGHLEGDVHVQEFLQENSNTPILIVAERFSEDVIIKLTDLHQRNVLNVCAVQCPEYDVKRKALLEDLALYSDGEVFLQGGSTKVVAGMVKKVIVTEGTTSIIQEKNSEATKNRITELKNQLKTVTDKRFIQKRIQNLEGASATIYVGGTTDVERKERFDLVEDAVSAIKSSLVEGWICGGGATLAYISTLMNTKFDNPHIQFGYEAMKRAIQAPFKQISINAKVDLEDEFVYEGVFNRWLSIPSDTKPNKVMRSFHTYGMGYNATTDEVSNLIEDGVIDSKYSIQVALDNAKSVARLLLNVKVVIT